MIVYVEKKVLEDPAIMDDDSFGPVKKKFCTFRAGDSVTDTRGPGWGRSPGTAHGQCALGHVSGHMSALSPARPLPVLAAAPRDPEPGLGRSSNS